MYYINLNNALEKRITFANQKESAREIGIAEETLSRILRGKQGCSKLVAFCITKIYDKNAEISDYFVFERE